MFKRGYCNTKILYAEENAFSQAMATRSIKAFDGRQYETLLPTCSEQSQWGMISGIIDSKHTSLLTLVCLEYRFRRTLAVTNVITKDKCTT